MSSYTSKSSTSSQMEMLKAQHVQNDEEEIQVVDDDLPDSIWHSKLNITISPQSSEQDEGDDPIILTPTKLEAIITTQLYDESRLLGDDESSRRASQISGIFVLGNTLKNVPTVVQDETNKLKDIITRSPVYDPFTLKTLFFSFITIILDFADYGTDTLVAVALSKDDQDTKWWFHLTLCFILVPLVLVNMFSIFWFYQDHRIKPTAIRRNAIFGRSGGLSPNRQKLSKIERRNIIISHCFLLAPLFRHVQIIYCGWKERKLRHQQRNLDSTKNLDRWREKIQGPYCVNPKVVSKQTAHLDYYTIRKYYERDSAYLGLIKGFMQDCPQLILQIYIIVVKDHKTLSQSLAVFQGFSVFTSLISLSWSLVCFEQANRWANPDKPQMTPVGCIIQLLWRFFMVASRVITLALFATCFRQELFIFLGLHWLLMTLWIVMMETNFCGSAENRKRPISELLYNFVMGFVGIFEYLHLKDGPTRLKYIFYYSLTFLEACGLMTLWYLETTKKFDIMGAEPPVPWSDESWYIISSLSTVPGCYILGIFFLGVYYKFYHPGGRMPDRRQPASLF